MVQDMILEKAVHVLGWKRIELVLEVWSIDLYTAGKECYQLFRVDRCEMTENCK